VPQLSAYLRPLKATLIASVGGFGLLLAGCSDGVNERVGQVFNLGNNADEPEAGALWTDPATSMEFVWVPSGEYGMGCAGWATDCRQDEKPAHVVALNGFWLGKFEVTQAQWRTVMGSNPSSIADKPLHPVETVSWHDVHIFIETLNTKSEATFRLPTEAEWEFACRSGGKKQQYAGGDSPDPVAWYGAYFNGNTGPTTQEVGRRQPNDLGLYDMLGNVSEWVEDTYEPQAYSDHASANPVVRTDGPNRVLRGGSWEHPADLVRCLTREFEAADDENANRGFRLVRIN